MGPWVAAHRVTSPIPVSARGDRRDHSNPELVMAEAITNMLDPPREEMMAVLEAYPYFNEADAFDWERAIYWFASD